MEISPQPRFNALHYIVVGVLGFFAGMPGGFLLCAVTQKPNDSVLFCWVLGGGILVAAGLPILLSKFSG